MNIPFKKEIGCICFSMEYTELIRIIRTTNCKDFRQFSKICPAGKGCGMCIPFIEKYIKQETGKYAKRTENNG